MGNEVTTKQNRMGTSPIFGLIVKMSVPAMLSMLVQALYNVVDSVFLGNYSNTTNPLTAVSLAYPLQMLMISFAVGTAVGVNSLIARRLGEGRRDSAEAAASHGLILSAATWLIFAAIGLFAARPFMLFMTSNQQIVSYGTDYITIVLVLSLGSFIQIMIEKSIQATGNMLFPMIAHLIGAVTNIILDPLMIFGLGPFPELGVKGAAYATVIGQWLAMAFLICIILFKKFDIRITFRRFRFSFSVVREIYKVGISGIVLQAISSVLVACINFIITISPFSVDTATAAQTIYGIYFKVQSFVFMPVFGLNQGISPIMGYNYGAKMHDRLLKTLRIGLTISAVIMFIGTLVFHLLPVQILQLFDTGEQFTAMGVVSLRRISLCFLPASVSVVFTALFQSVGKGVRSLLMSVLRQLVLVLPLVYILSRYSIDLMWFAFPIAEVGALIVAVVFFVDLYKKELSSLGKVRG